MRFSVADMGGSREVERRDGGERVRQSALLRWRSSVTAAALVVGTLVACLAVYVARTTGYFDFLLLHHSAQGIVEGHDLYVGAPTPGSNLNAPHTMLLLAPLGWLPVDVAVVPIWLAIGVSAWYLARLLDGTAPTVARPLMFVLLASPAWYLGVRLANLAWPIAVGVTVAWLWHRAGRLRAAGLLLGVLASTKLFLLLFAPYLVWRRQWTTLRALGVAVVAMFAVGMTVCGPGAYLGWLNAMNQVVWEFSPTNMTVLGLTTRFFTPPAETLGISHPIFAAPWLVRPLWMLMSLSLITLAWLRLRRHPDPDAEWAVVILTGFLVSPLAWVYYLPLAAGPIAVMLERRSFDKGFLIAAICLLVPYRFMLLVTATNTGGTVTVGSAYALGALILWHRVLFGGPSSVCVRTSESRA